MKRLLSVLAFVVVACLSMKAQDIILKTDGTEIQAVVEEISETSVRYKLFSNPNGPVRVMEITSIFRISFSDGSVEIFTTPEKTTSSKSIDNNLTRTTLASLPWDLKGNKLYAGSHYLTDSQLLEFDEELYSSFKSGRSMKATGEIIWACGLGFEAGALIGGLIWEFNYVTLVEVCIGAALVLIGAPLDICGTVKMNNVVNSHNNTLSLSLAPSIVPYYSQVNTSNMKFAPGLAVKFSF